MTHMRRLVFVAACTASAAATLSPCGRHAFFSITADGGTNFEAQVRVPRWQPGKSIALDFGVNAIRLRPTSVTGGATLLPASASASPVFRLEARDEDGRAGASFPPGVITFRADGLPSQPTVTCDLKGLAAFSPAPPPPPPQCAASFIWRNGRKWNGGFEAFIDVSGGGVPPGFAVRADLKGQTGPELIAADKASLVSLESGVLLLRPELPNGRGTITLRVRGNGGGSPQVACVLAPPAPPPPPMAVYSHAGPPTQDCSRTRHARSPLSFETQWRGRQRAVGESWGLYQ